MTRKTVFIIILIWGIVSVLIDIYLATLPGGLTWSQTLAFYGDKTPFIPWVLGGLPGHFFAKGGKLPCLTPKWGQIVLVFVTAVITTMGFWMPFSPWNIALGGFITWSLTWQA